jgi:hypothetical protein
MITEKEASSALLHAKFCAWRQWKLDGEACDLSEYEDAASEAITRCLARFDPTKGCKFNTYCEQRVFFALVDAAQAYKAWRFRGSDGREEPQSVEEQMDLAARMKALPPLIRRYVQAALDGLTLTQFAQLQGHRRGWMSKQLRTYRTAQGAA